MFEDAKSSAPLTVSEACKNISSSEVLVDVTEAILRKEEDVSKDQNVNSTVQCRTVTSGDGDTDVLLKFMSSVECPNPFKRCIRCQKCDQCKKTYLPDQEKNEKMIEVLKQNVLYDEKEKCYQANYVYNKEIKNLSSYEHKC